MYTQRLPSRGPPAAGHCRRCCRPGGAGPQRAGTPIAHLSISFALRVSSGGGKVVEVKQRCRLSVEFCWLLSLTIVNPTAERSAGNHAASTQRQRLWSVLGRLWAPGAEWMCMQAMVHYEPGRSRPRHKHPAPWKQLECRVQSSVMGSQSWALSPQPEHAADRASSR